EYRQQGIGKQMAHFAMRALQEEGINKVSLIAFQSNEVGNRFWRKVGWTYREDLNYYDFTLNESNITKFVTAQRGHILARSSNVQESSEIPPM
ncbi:MAG: GNAT family N-acetyltransferase, partial [Hungatella sp.]